MSFKSVKEKVILRVNGLRLIRDLGQENLHSILDCIH